MRWPEGASAQPGEPIPQLNILVVTGGSSTPAIFTQGPAARQKLLSSMVQWDSFICIHVESTGWPGEEKTGRWKKKAPMWAAMMVQIIVEEYGLNVCLLACDQGSFWGHLLLQVACGFFGNAILVGGYPAGGAEEDQKLEGSQLAENPAYVTWFHSEQDKDSRLADFQNKHFYESFQKHGIAKPNCMWYCDKELNHEECCDVFFEGCTGDPKYLSLLKDAWEHSLSKTPPILACGVGFRG